MSDGQVFQGMAWCAMAAVLCSGCLGDVFAIGCTTEMRSNLRAEVRDAATGAAAAYGARGWARHEQGATTELFALDSVSLVGNWDNERAGDYQVEVRKPGHRLASERITVREDACHVKTGTVRVSLAGEPAAQPVAPVSFSAGARVGGFTNSAGVTVSGDTLVITGRALAPCATLQPVGYRVGYSLHVQLEPGAWPWSCGEREQMQQFEARYQLQQGANDVLVTAGFGWPGVLFDGMVQGQGGVPAEPVTAVAAVPGYVFIAATTGQRHHAP
jgi:hypothetical protein